MSLVLFINFWGTQIFGKVSLDNETFEASSVCPHKQCDQSGALKKGFAAALTSTTSSPPSPPSRLSTVQLEVARGTFTLASAGDDAGHQ